MSQITEEKTHQEAILAEVDEFVRASVSQMTPRQVKRALKESNRIMKESSRRSQRCGDTDESARSRLRVHRA